MTAQLQEPPPSALPETPIIPGRRRKAPSARWILYQLLVMLLALLSFTGGYLLHWRQHPPLFPVLMEAYDILRTDGLNPLPPDPAVEYGMVRGMLQAYGDPHTTFLEPPQNELEGFRLSGSYGGIGADIEQDLDGFWIIYPYPGGPADEAGIHAGDRMIRADGIEITPESSKDSVLAAVRGPVGGSLRLWVGRSPGWEPVLYALRYEEYPLPWVSTRIHPTEPRLGIVYITLIASDTAGEVEKAIGDLSSRGATHFVLDLRDNPGGLLTDGVELARLFLDSGVVMEQHFRDQAVHSFTIKSPGPLVKLPLIVFINGNSASAAEIAAGALQAHGRAVLIGSPSYGKTTIQLIHELQDGSSLHVTTARWIIPGLAYEIDAGGLRPNVPVSVPDGADGDPLYLQAAIREFFGSNQ